MISGWGVASVMLKATVETAPPWVVAWILTGRTHCRSEAVHAAAPLLERSGVTKVNAAPCWEIRICCNSARNEFMWMATSLDATHCERHRVCDWGAVHSALGMCLSNVWRAFAFRHDEVLSSHHEASARDAANFGERRELHHRECDFVEIEGE